MGKKLDVLLGRSFKSSKFKTLTNLAISRLAVLKNQRQARFSMVRNDVVQLLNLGHHERALLRVDQVIKDQNMLDAFVMMEGYCILLSERVKVIEYDKECPDELKEAIASLIFAASRCGEFPELQEIRAVFTSRFGKEFTSRATELRNSCGVNTKLIQKLSSKQSSLDERMKVLKEIADKNGTALQLEDSSSIAAEEKLNTVKTQSASFDSNEHGDELRNFHEEVDGVERFSNSMNTKKQYKDVADAAQEAFMSAAYAAAAARAAVELSRSYPRAPDNPNDPKYPRKQQIFDSNDEVISRHQTSEKDYPGKTENAVSDNEVMEEEIEVGLRSSSMKISGAQEKDKELPKGVTFEEGDDEAKSETLSSLSDDNPWIERGMKPKYFSQKQSPSSIQDGSSIDDSTKVLAGLAGKSAQRMNTEKGPFSVRTRR